eukprot:15465808-Alexandrium_andersonii.AAC.1
MLSGAFRRFRVLLASFRFRPEAHETAQKQIYRLGGPASRWGFRRFQALSVLSGPFGCFRATVGRFRALWGFARKRLKPPNS